MGSKYPTARMVEPAVESTLSTWNFGGYCQYLRGIPKYPRMNCGQNVRLKPTNTSSAANLTQASGYMCLEIFGHQKCSPPRYPKMTPLTQMHWKRAITK